MTRRSTPVDARDLLDRLTKARGANVRVSYPVSGIVFATQYTMFRLLAVFVLIFSHSRGFCLKDKLRHCDQLFGGRSLVWPEKRIWSENKNSPFNITNFSQAEMAISESVIEKAIAHYKSGEIKEAYNSLIEPRAAEEIRIRFEFLDRSIKCGASGLMEIEDNFSKITEGAGFNPSERKFRLPRIVFKPCPWQIFISRRTQLRIDAAFEQLFLITLEEWIHFAQYSHGRTLSDKFSHPIFGTKGNLSDYAVSEMDIPFILEQWGIPFDQRLLNRYDFRAMSFCKAFPGHGSCPRGERPK